MRATARVGSPGGPETRSSTRRPPAPRPTAEPPAAERVTAERVTVALREVLDPELGVNIVDLGLVYDVRVAADGAITVEMTLTSRACPLADLLRDAVLRVLGALAPQVPAHLTWVWRPTWGPGRITAEGREQLRALGFTV